MSQPPKGDIRELLDPPPLRPARSLRLWMQLLLALLVLGGGWFYTFQLRYPLPAASGVALQGDALPLRELKPGDRFRIASYNIHRGVGTDGKEDLGRIAAVLKDADLVGLNEVRGSLPWSPVTQAEELGRSLNMLWLFAPTEMRYGGPHFGNAVLSKVKVESWQRTPLPQVTPAGRRNLAVLQVPVGQRKLWVLVTHLHTRSDNRQGQMDAVMQAFTRTPAGDYAVLMGDFNATTNDAQLSNLLKEPGVIDAVGSALQMRAGNTQQPGRIDWILTRGGLEVLDGGLRDEGGSDHPCVWAELRIPEAKP